MSRFHVSKLFSIAMLLGLMAVAVHSGRAEETPASPQTAPAWKLKDLAGNDVSSDQFKGKVVIVDFWATWCQPCIGEIPGYIELQKKYGPAGLAIVGIAYRDFKGPENVKKFAEAKGMNYTIVIGDETVADAFGGIEGIPATFLIGRDGRILHRKVGALPAGEYEKIVERALN